MRLIRLGIVITIGVVCGVLVAAGFIAVQALIQRISLL